MSKFLDVLVLSAHLGKIFLESPKMIAMLPFIWKLDLAVSINTMPRSVLQADMAAYDQMCDISMKFWARKRGIPAILAPTTTTTTTTPHHAAYQRKITTSTLGGGT